MSKDYLAHWVIGLFCLIIWCFGDRAGIPPAVVNLAAYILPGLVGHAVGYQPSPAQYDPPPALGDPAGISGNETVSK